MATHLIHFVYHFKLLYSESFVVNKGLKQGDALPVTLFSLVLEHILRSNEGKTNNIITEQRYERNTENNNQRRKKDGPKCSYRKNYVIAN